MRRSRRCSKRRRAPVSIDPDDPDSRRENQEVHTMKRSTALWLTASCALMLAAAVAARSERPAAAGAIPTAHHHDHHNGPLHVGKHPGKLQERFLYVSTISQSKTDPDFITVVGADPRYRDFGRIVNRV